MREREIEENKENKLTGRNALSTIEQIFTRLCCVF